jgi:hypothetical protein
MCELSASEECLNGLKTHVRGPVHICHLSVTRSDRLFYFTDNKLPGLRFARAQSTHS